MRFTLGTAQHGDTTEAWRQLSAGSHRRKVQWLSGAAAAFIILVSSCATAPPAERRPASSPPAIPETVDDQRGRFREVFCAVLEERGEELPDPRPCGEALTRVGIEPDGTGKAVELGRSRRRLAALFVPGIGWNCIEDWLDPHGSAAEHLGRFGFELGVIDVEALSSTGANARLIRDAILAMGPAAEDPDLVLVGYSKGVPDILEAVVAYPEIRPRIAAVVSLAGAVGGSPVAEEVQQEQAELLRHWPGSDCSSGDAGAVESLRPTVRRAWLADNPLPPDVPFYSLVTLPAPDRISSVLKPTYRRLCEIDPDNDGMVLFTDQIIPGSTLLGCVNADHWAVAVPISRTHRVVGATVVNHNDYPREALLEAILRFVEEDLNAAQR